MNLADKYRPANLDQIIGQPWIVEQLRLFLESPHSTAFLFEGDTGTGKTSAALALATELGIIVERREFSGLWEIASGEQTGETVRRTMEKLRVTPWEGSGWRVLIVNEADAMTPNAAVIWLDVLENLPPRTVVIFTTNEAQRIPARLRDRCERFRFEGGLNLLPYLQEHAARVWQAETGRTDCPEIGDFGPIADEKGTVSVRRLLQLMQPFVRSKAAPAAKPVVQKSKPADIVQNYRAADQNTLANVLERRRKGEAWKILAQEVGVPETTLRGRLYRSGLLKRGERIA